MFAKVFDDDQARLFNAYVIWHTSQKNLSCSSRRENPDAIIAPTNSMKPQARELACCAKRSPIGHFHLPALDCSGRRRAIDAGNAARKGCAASLSLAFRSFCAAAHVQHARVIGVVRTLAFRAEQDCQNTKLKDREIGARRASSPNIASLTLPPTVHSQVRSPATPSLA